MTKAKSTKSTKSKEELFIAALLQCSNLNQFRNPSDEQLATKVLADILRSNSKKQKTSLSKKSTPKKATLLALSQTPLSPEIYSEKYLTPRRAIALSHNKQGDCCIPSHNLPKELVDGCFTHLFMGEQNNPSQERLKQIQQAETALRQLSPGKKALLESLFDNRSKTSIQDLATQLNEPEEKIIKLKDEALRSLIYKIL